MYSLTDWLTDLTHSPTNSAQLKSTQLAEFSLTIMLITSRHGSHWNHCCSVVVYGPLPSNGRCLVVSLSLPSDGSTCHNIFIIGMFLCIKVTKYKWFQKTESVGSNGNAVDFFGRLQVRISGETSGILTPAFRGFSQSLQANQMTSVLFVTR
jgi:hypothetical protein